jgi:hypothetical protein
MGKAKNQMKDLAIIKFIGQIRLQESILIGRREFSHLELIARCDLKT